MVVTHFLLYLTRKRCSGDSYKLLEQVTLGPEVLNQVKSRSFDPSCADNCRKAQNKCQVTTTTRNSELGGGRKAELGVLPGLV